MFGKRAPRATSESDLSFHYDRLGQDGVMDQTLSISNRGPSAVELRLSWVPLDASGRELPGLEVTSAYGTEVGRHLVPAGLTDVDVLAFHGPGERDVADVRVRVEAIEQGAVRQQAPRGRADRPAGRP